MRFPVSLFATAAALAVPIAAHGTGPADDYPVTIGAPYEIDGKTYTPSDALNYDAVGYAVSDDSLAGDGHVSMAHRTLPVPSYAEVTSLDSGHTILVRVEARGPMTGNAVAALSPAAWAQLGLPATGRVTVRVRRINPPETERALLRTGQHVPERMTTPAGLLNVLRRRLGDAPETPLASAAPLPAPTPVHAAAAVPTIHPVEIAASTPAPPPVATPTPAPTPVKPATKPPEPKPIVKPIPAPEPPHKVEKPKVAKPKAEPKVEPKKAENPAPRPKVEKPKPTPAKPAPAKPAPAKAEAGGHYTVHVGTFGVEGNARAAAGKTGGRVVQSGKFWVVVIGPAGKGAADAALAKAHAAGLKDALIQHNN